MARIDRCEALPVGVARGGAYGPPVRLGIDFGTTRTVVAMADRGNYPVVTFESDVGDATEWFPSVVAERGGELRFGHDALAVARDPEWTSLRSVKRFLSAGRAGVAEPVRIGSLEIGAAELVARFLDALRNALATRSNVARALKKSSTLEAVVATPANALCTQRLLTLDAFRGAGFEVRAMLNEPSAAGFEYAHRHARTLSSVREHVLVYDLGGGTFDASLVRMTGTHHEVVTTSGIGQLGGDDFDRVLADLVLEKAARPDAPSFAALAESSPALAARLLDECRAAKEALAATARKVTVDVDPVFGGGLEPVSIATAAFYEAATPLVNRTLEALAPVLKAESRDGAEEPAAEEGLPEGVAGLYVVGGASALPIIGRLLRARFGRRVHRSPYPHAAVAIGLAIAGDEEAGFELVDRLSRNFGVFREEDGGARATYDAILTRDLALPRAGDPPLVIERRYRAAHDLGHYRFFECSDFDAGGAPRGEIAPLTDVRFPFARALQEKLARHSDATLADWPVHRLAQEGPLVVERYAVDASGMVEVTITDLESGYHTTSRLGALG